MPEGVTGIRVSGRLRGDDLREFKPAMEEPLTTGEISFLVALATPAHAESSPSRTLRRARTRATRWGALTARQWACADSMSLNATATSAACEPGSLVIR